MQANARRISQTLLLHFLVLYAYHTARDRASTGRRRQNCLISSKFDYASDSSWELYQLAKTEKGICFDNFHLCNAYTDGTLTMIPGDAYPADLDRATEELEMFSHYRLLTARFRRANFISSSPIHQLLGACDKLEMPLQFSSDAGRCMDKNCAKRFFIALYTACKLIAVSMENFDIRRREFYCVSYHNLNNLTELFERACDAISKAIPW